MTSNKKVKILCAYHKKTKLFKSNILLPFLGGSELLEPDNKDYNWLNKHLLKDNTGDNISKYNKSLNEMTIIYWAYKNYHMLDNPDYIGLNHYRRLFNFSGKKLNRFNIVKSLGMDNSDKIIQIFEDYNYDIVACKLAFSDKVSSIERVKKLISEIKLKEKHEGMYRAFLRFCETGAFYCGNIAVFKRDDFFKYCETIFNIILPLQISYINEGNPNANTRFLGSACELLTGFYIDYLEHECGYKIKNQEISNLADYVEKKNIKIPLEKIFSVKNENSPKGRHKVVTVMGLKIKFKKNKKTKHSSKDNTFRIDIQGKNNKIYLIDKEHLLKPLEDYAPIPIKIIGDNNEIILSADAPFLNSNIFIKSNNSTFKMGYTANYIVSFNVEINHGNNQTIQIGDNFSMGGGWLYALEKDSKIIIGDNCMFSTDICIMSSDGHPIFDKNSKQVLNFSKEIIIGNKVWLGKFSKVLKNSKISDNSIVGINSLVNKKIDKSNVILAGAPAKIVKENIEWDRTSISDYKE